MNMKISTCILYIYAVCMQINSMITQEIITPGKLNNGVILPKQTLPRHGSSNALSDGTPRVNIKMDPRTKYILAKRLRERIRLLKEEQARRNLARFSFGQQPPVSQLGPPRYRGSRIPFNKPPKTVYNNGALPKTLINPHEIKKNDGRTNKDVMEEMEAERVMRKIEAAENTKECNSMQLFAGIIIGISSTAAFAGVFLVTRYILFRENRDDGKSKWILKRKPTLPKRNVKKEKENKYVHRKPIRGDEEYDLYDKIGESDDTYIDDAEIEPIREEHEISMLRPAPSIPRGHATSLKQSGIYEIPIQPGDNDYLEFE